MISPFYQRHKNNIRISIFKTNIETKDGVSIIKKLFSSDPRIKQWSVDLEDIDKVLRIEAIKSLSKKDIICFVIDKGFYCEELD
ncbi:hypothetical protein [Psychroserpens sp.]